MTTRPLLDRFLPTTKTWIAKKVGEFITVQFKVGYDEHEKSRNEINIIIDMIRSEAPECSKEQIRKALWNIYHQNKENVT